MEGSGLESEALLTDRGNLWIDSDKTYRHAQDSDFLLLRHFDVFTIENDPQKEVSGEGKTKLC